MLSHRHRCGGEPQSSRPEQVVTAEGAVDIERLAGTGRAGRQPIIGAGRGATP